MEFVKETKAKEFDTSVFQRGHAYLCTFRHPVSGATYKIFGIFKHGNSKMLEFVITDPVLTIMKISINDIDIQNLTIEKMMEPMSEQELYLLKHLLIKCRAEYFEDRDIRDIIDRIRKKFGFDV